MYINAKRGCVYHITKVPEIQFSKQKCKQKKKLKKTEVEKKNLRNDLIKNCDDTFVV